MLYLENIAYYLPEKRMRLDQMQEATGASKSTLRVFESFYGLKTIAVETEVNTLSMMQNLTGAFFKNDSVNKSDFKYIVHCHAAREAAPFAKSCVQLIKAQMQLNNARAVGSSMLKCVSFIGFLKTLETVMQNSENEKALLMTGDIGFTPELRLVPRVTVCGDAATAVVVQSKGTRNQLLAVETQFLAGYSKGIYLEMSEMHTFDQHFISLMTRTILNSLKKAKLTLDDIVLVLPHNVNQPTWEKICEALMIDKSKIYTQQIENLGHCFASDGIVNLCLALEEGLIKPGQHYLMAGCGLGVFFASAVFKH